MFRLNYRIQLVLMIITLQYCLKSLTTAIKQIRTNSIVRKSLFSSESRVFYPQSLDFTSMYYSVKELQHYLPCKIENIIQDENQSVFLQFKSKNSEYSWIQMCWHPQFSWFALAFSPYRSRKNRLSFETVLSSFLIGTTMTKISMVDKSNRIVSFDFSESLSSDPKYRLYVEVLGVHSNVILVNTQTNNILSCAYQVSGNKGGRSIQVSTPYQFVSNSRIKTILNDHQGHKSTTQSDSVINTEGINHFSELFTSKLTEISSNRISDQEQIVKYLLGLSPRMSPNIAYTILQFAFASSTSEQNDISDNSLTDQTIERIQTLYNIWFHEMMKSDDLNSTHGLSLESLQLNSILDNCVNSIPSHLKMVVKPNRITLIDNLNNTHSYYTPIQFTENTDLSFNAQYDSTKQIILTYLKQYYHDAFRKFQYYYYKAESEKKVKKLLTKTNTLITIFDKQLFDASNGKADELRYQADLITSYIHTAKQVKVVVSTDDNHDGNKYESSRNLNISNDQVYFRSKDSPVKVDLIDDSGDYQSDMDNYDNSRINSSNNNINSNDNNNKKISSSKTYNSVQHINAIVVSRKKPKSGQKINVYKPSYVVYCDDFHTQERKEILISNGMTPIEYTAYLYKQAKKIKRSVDKLKLLKEQAQTHCDYLREIETSIDNVQSCNNINDIITLREINDELDSLRHMSVVSLNDTTDCYNSEAKTKARTDKEKNKRKPTLSNQKTSSKNPSQVQENVVTSRKKLSGLLVLSPSDFVSSQPNSNENEVENNNVWKKIPPLVVGRNSKQNERVTFEIAKPHHLWFHVQDSPGSHCLLLLDPGKEASMEAIQFAADVASYFSQSKNDKKVEVRYCSPKYLKKPAGGKPGLVMMLQQSGTMLGRPDNGKKYYELFGPKDFGEKK